ncbi:hypothetical protein GZL_05141 [Streptomyces sp. 769]|nr:hypothetical protein GZL_05141 [Streptomyces sp. 769]
MPRGGSVGFAIVPPRPCRSHRTRMRRARQFPDDPSDSRLAADPLDRQGADL